MQADHFTGLAEVKVQPITGMLLDVPLVRVEVEPDAQNGLTKRSQVMVDKPQTLRRGKMGAALGTWTTPPCSRPTAPRRCSLA